MASLLGRTIALAVLSLEPAFARCGPSVVKFEKRVLRESFISWTPKA
jgi:hypothetical protein